MPSLAVFSSCGELCASDQDSHKNPSHITKKALILISGEHRDNRGIVHNFPPLRLQQIATNTNRVLAKGGAVPFMADHAKTLIYSKGGIAPNGDLPLSQLGWLNPDKGVWTKVIEPGDLPNPKQSHLVGQIGIFGEMQIHRNRQDVEAGVVKLLSPGIDLENERIGEISAVAFPAIQGPALFSEGLDYASAKQRFNDGQKLRDRLREENEIFFSAVQRITSASPDQMLGLDPKALQLQAIADYSESLRAILGLTESQQSEPDSGSTSASVSLPNPYEPNLLKASQQSAPASYSQSASEDPRLIHRRKKTADFTKKRKTVKQVRRKS